MKIVSIEECNENGTQNGTLFRKPRAYFDQSSEKCKYFKKDQCNANENKFYTKSECERKCEGISNYENIYQ